MWGFQSLEGQGLIGKMLYLRCGFAFGCGELPLSLLLTHRKAMALFRALAVGPGLGVGLAPLLQ